MISYGTKRTFVCFVFVAHVNCIVHISALPHHNLNCLTHKFVMDLTGSYRFTELVSGRAGGKPSSFHHVSSQEL